MLLKRLEALRPHAAALVDPQGRAVVDRMLEDIFLEALCTVERPDALSKRPDPVNVFALANSSVP